MERENLIEIIRNLREKQASLLRQLNEIEQALKIQSEKLSQITE